MARADVLPTLALGLLCLLPGAGACSWALPPDLSTLLPAGDGLAANAGWTTAGLVAPDGSYVAVVPVGPQTMAWSASPDGRWFAFASGAPVDEPQGGIHGYSTCWMPLGATEVVDVVTGARVRLLDGAAYALAFGDGSLAVAHPEGVLVYVTGAWTRPERADLPLDASAVRLLAWSGDGRVLAAATWDGRVAVAGARLDPAPWDGDSPPAAVALDERGERLAVLVGDALHTANVAAGRWTREVPLGARGAGLAWRSPWLAASSNAEGSTVVRVVPDGWTEAESPPEPDADTAWVEKTATLDGAAGGIAWLANGTLAVASGEDVALLDDDLATIARHPVRAEGTPRFPAPDLDAERGPPREAPAWGALGAALAFALAARRRQS